VRDLDPEHLAWCRRQMDLLAEDGLWVVPRSGLVFRKRNDTLMLIGRSDPPPGWTLAEQEDDYEVIREYMDAAGIKVGRELE
jgi:hypothetical protein